MKRRHLSYGAKLLFGGYTVVEVMIFLAVSGALIIVAFTFMNGRLDRTRFSQAVVELEEQLQDTFNDASTGFYPSGENFNCYKQAPRAGDGATVPDFSNVDEGLGSNEGCIFVGKLVHFFTDGSDRADTNYDIYTMVASNDITEDQLNLEGAANRPPPIRLLGTKTIGGPNSTPGIAQFKEIGADIFVYKRITDTGQPVGHGGYNTLAVIADLTTSGFVSGEEGSNSSRLKLYGYSGPIPGNDQGLMDMNPGKFYEIKGSALLCLKQDAIAGNTRSDRTAVLEIDKQLTIKRYIASQPKNSAGDDACTAARDPF